MNAIEKRMLEILKKGKSEFGYVGIKSEFEAEGIRMEELLRLIDLTRRVDLNIGIKIGGCEAISDLHTCKKIGAEYVIAPMIETPYSLSKFITAKNKAYTKEEQEETSFLFNLETITAYDNLIEIIHLAETEIDGIVFGRVDFGGSLKLNRKDVLIEEVTNYCINVANLCKEYKLDFIIGGAINLESITMLKKAKEVFLTRFETRKVIINSDSINTDDLSYLKYAIEFELLALKNKCNYYKAIADEDSNRMKLLEERLEKFKS